MQEENHRVTVKNLLITATVESEGSETENRNLNKPPIHLRLIKQKQKPLR